MTVIVREGAKDPEVSICIPTLNLSEPRIHPILSFIRTNVGLEYEIVITDCQGELRGYTAPMNEAMAAAKGEYLLAMNDDVIISPGTVGTLVRALLEDGAWCATPDQTHCDGPQVFAPYCMMWHADEWHQLGGLDEQFIWWCSDIDIARRLYDVGHLPHRVQLPIPIEHHPGTTATGRYQTQLTEWALHDLSRFHNKWGISAEEEKVRLAVVCGANLDPRLVHLRP